MRGMRRGDAVAGAGAAAGAWLAAHWRALLVHVSIVSAFLGFCAFFSGPLFERLEALPGESRSESISLPQETGGVAYHLDTVKGGPYVAEVRGWAYIDGQSPDDSQVYVVLQSAGSCRVFDTMTLLADYTDVTFASYPSGFVCNIPASRVDEGRYEIGVYVRKGDLEAFQPTGSVLVMSKSGFA